MPIPEKTRVLIVFVLKAFGVVGFWLFFLGVFLFGLFLVFQKKLINLKFNISLVGIFLAIFAFLALVTYVLTLESKTFNYENIQDYVTTILHNDNLIKYDVTTSGGLIGFYFVATLNYLSFPGGLATASLLFLGGLIIIFRNPIIKLFKLIKQKHLSHKKEKEYYSQISKDNEPKESHSAFIGKENKELLLNDDFTFKRPKSDENDSPFKTVLVSEEGLKRPVFQAGDQEVISQRKPSLEKPHLDVNEEKLMTKEVEVLEDLETETILESTPIKKQIEEPKKKTVSPTIVKQEVVEEVIVSDKYVRPSFIFPSLDLLDYHESMETLRKNEMSTNERLILINTIFEDLKIGASAISYTIGPSVTRFDIQMEKGTSLNTISRYIDDISSRLGGIRARFEPIVSGKMTSGLEIQNDYRSNVGLKESLKEMPTGGRLNRDIPLGKSISGQLLSVNIDDLPHMLVAGVTGSGKSIFVHSLITTLIMRNHPDELKLMIIDPKRVELAHYEDLPHLLCPLITEMTQAKVAFDRLVDEMENRYVLFQEKRVTKISEYNRLMNQEEKAPLPYIVVFVDEFADLNDTVRDIHEPVIRIAQKARAAGIHLFISTQRPTTDVIKPRIKSNLPAHVALMMNNFTDSTTIIGKQGAEKLLGNGDMLIEIPIISRTSNPRLQGCFVSLDEIKRVVDFIKKQLPPSYHEDFINLDEVFEDFHKASNQESITSSKELAENEIYKLVASDMIERGFISISYIQRNYGVGFPRAGRIFARLQKDGLVANEPSSQKGCEVLIKSVSQIPGYNEEE